MGMETQERHLPRVLGLWDIVSIVIGGVIGSGIFLVPKDMAAAVQVPLLILAVWAVGGMLSFFGALSFGELGAAMPEAGGAYVFLRESYGSMISFLFGWTLFLVIDTGAIATLTVAFSSKYLTHFFPISPLGQKMISVAFLLFLMIVNYVGVRWGANLQNLLTIIKFGALVGICGVIFILAKGNASNFVNPSPKTFSGNLLGSFGIALVASLWAYKGWESSTYSAGETKNPQRNLPLGLFIGTAACIAIYILAQLAYLYVLPAGEIAKSDRIAADAMNLVVGPIGASIISFIILFSIMGATNQNFLCSPRVYYAMAKDGIFFKGLTAIHPKFLTPHVSIIAMGVWSMILILFFGTFERLFTYVIFGQWIFFGLTVAAVIILRKKKPGMPRPYKTWGYPITPIVFIVAALYISINSLITQFWNAVSGLVIILLGLSPFAFWRIKKAKKILAMDWVVFIVGLLVWDTAALFLLEKIVSEMWLVISVGGLFLINGVIIALVSRLPKKEITAS